MNLYKISQNKKTGWDTYDSAVVAAETEEEARNIHPSEYVKGGIVNEENSSTWVAKPEHVTVELIGIARISKRGVIVSSFNAG